MSFFDDLGIIITSCIVFLQYPLNFGGITISLWMCFLSCIVILIVGKLIWGLFA
ncbi:MAG TPA: hypothetical protein VHO94_06385 [Oscillospiraceae bacterium]|nr:hypothetical protein [Oscillospiraceae bacterium]